MAEPTAPEKTPNRAWAFFLLVLTVLGTGYFLVVALWKLFHEDRISGFGWFFLGLAWFVFFSWRQRATLKPKPSG